MALRNTHCGISHRYWRLYFFRAIAQKDGRIGAMEDSYEDLKKYRELIAKIRETNPEYCSENQGKIDYANGIYEALHGYLNK